MNNAAFQDGENTASELARILRAVLPYALSRLEDMEACGKDRHYKQACRRIEAAQAALLRVS